MLCFLMVGPAQIVITCLIVNLLTKCSYHTSISSYIIEKSIDIKYNLLRTSLKIHFYKVSNFDEVNDTLVTCLLAFLLGLMSYVYKHIRDP